jgi:polyisoprenyl-teichoic acid--peptidoglycan teichoic acid transferase
MTEERGGKPPDRDDGATDEIENVIDDDFEDEFGADVAAELDKKDDADPGQQQSPSQGEADESDGQAPGGDEAARERALQETVEADVLALGDAEEAAEAASAGTEDGGGGEAAPEPDGAAGEDGKDGTEAQADEEAGEGKVESEPEADQEEAGETTGETPVAAAVATAEPPPPARRIAPVAKQPEEPPEDDSAPRSKLWLRFVAASLVIVVSMATATSVSILLYLSEIAEGLSDNDRLSKLQDQLESVDGGEPQTILILGSDERAGDPSARSDTTMLLRLDPEQDAIALFSLPRDLKVNVPGYGVDRLNAAYTVGGPELTLKTVKQVTGLPIHHVVNVDFTGFGQAVNAIDCVYVDVDRRYYVPPEADYAEIDIEAGYQLLCGERALQYVRFRHADTDITRSARQQDFLREARQKIGPGRLFRDRDELIKIFTKYTTSDIDDPETMLQILKLFLDAHDAPVKEIHFEGNVGPSYITFSQEQMQGAVDQFLGIEATGGPRGGGIEGAEEASGGDGGGGGDKDEPEPDLIDSSEFGAKLGGRFAEEVKFPVFYPTKLTPGSQFSSDSRTYQIEDDDGQIHNIYKFVIQTPLLGEYFGVSGTTWTDPPILDNPSETREIGNRTYDLFFDGDRLRLVAWRMDKGAYWLNNTLLQSIEEGQMLEIAETMREAEPPRK